MFVLLTSISQYISEIVLLSEYEILTARLVNTKLLGFRLLWDVTVYVIGRQNCPTYCIIMERATLFANQYCVSITGIAISGLTNCHWPLAAHCTAYPEAPRGWKHFSNNLGPMISFFIVKRVSLCTATKTSETGSAAQPMLNTEEPATLSFRAISNLLSSC